jgi:hypothetical protein
MAQGNWRPWSANARTGSDRTAIRLLREREDPAKSFENSRLVSRFGTLGIRFSPSASPLFASLRPAPAGFGVDPGCAQGGLAFATAGIDVRRSNHSHSSDSERRRAVLGDGLRR